MTTNQVAASEGAPVRGSRGRHAGPAATGQPASVRRADLAGLARRGLAICRANPLVTTAGLIIVAMVAGCFIGPMIYHTDQTHVFFSSANLSPRAGHPFGTDSDGADELGRLMKAGQVSLEVGAP